MPAIPPQPQTVVQGCTSCLPCFTTPHLPSVAAEPALCPTPLQRLTATASIFQQMTTLLVRPAAVRAAANMLDMANQLLAFRRQKTIDAAVLWLALTKYPHDEGKMYRAKHFASAAEVSQPTLATASKALDDDLKFTTELHLKMCEQWIAAGDSERRLAPESESANRGTKRGREESAAARSPSELAASLAEDAVFFPMKKKIHVDESQLVDDRTDIRIVADSCQPTPGQLQSVMLTKHCKKHLTMAKPCVVVPLRLCNCSFVSLVRPLQVYQNINIGV